MYSGRIMANVSSSDEAVFEVELRLRTAHFRHRVSCRPNGPGFFRTCGKSLAAMRLKKRAILETHGLCRISQKNADRIIDYGASPEEAPF